jgi:hypothetical protein
MILKNRVGRGGGGWSPSKANQGVKSKVWQRKFLALLTFLIPTTLAASDCLPIGEASKHVGENKCIVGRVLRVKAGARGVHYVDFCEDQMSCPFNVVVFGSDLKDIGDVRRLAGRVIEIRGPVKMYNGRAEIVLKRVSQLTGGGTLIPPLPKNYDVEKQGHYSAGSIHPPAKLKTAKPTVPATTVYGNEADASSEPQ